VYYELGSYFDDQDDSHFEEFQIETKPVIELCSWQLLLLAAL